MSKVNNKNMKNVHKYFRKQRDRREFPTFALNNWKKMHGEVKYSIVQRKRAHYGCVKHR